MIPAQNPETVTVAFDLPLWVPLPEESRFITETMHEVRGRYRSILVDRLWLSDSEYVWCSGPIVRKADGETGTYRDEGWVFLESIPDEVCRLILNLVLNGVETE
jgi:hypothetical protein